MLLLLSRLDVLDTEGMLEQESIRAFALEPYPCSSWTLDWVHVQHLCDEIPTGYPIIIYVRKRQKCCHDVDMIDVLIFWYFDLMIF